MNNKGQALVEFIIILPVIVMLFLAVFDYVRINQVKYELESAVEDIIINDNSINDDSILFDVDINDKNKTYTLSKDVDIYSPILVPIINNKYKVLVKRTIYE